jgi:hypothetical protein
MLEELLRTGNLPISVPGHLLRGDLFWWRESPDIHTLITLWGLPLAQEAKANRLTFVFALFNPQGELQTHWQQDLSATELLAIDSAHPPSSVQIPGRLTEGVLAIFATTDSPLPPEFKSGGLKYMVDWYSGAGELVSLHSDQRLEQHPKPVEWTEIVVLETLEQQNLLVVINGPIQQLAHSLSIEIKNADNQVQTASYGSMRPFSLHKIWLNQLFPDLLDFCQGAPVSLSGIFAAQGIFCRPYVMTQGKQYWSGYHGGNRYNWSGLPQLLYSYLGAGEVNPMVVLNRPGLTTAVNLLHTHGEIETDFWVDVRLYDQAGQLVVDRPRWLLAKRHQLSRGEIRALLPDPEADFIGHIALRFAAGDHPVYPGRLQALMEYGTPISTARVMAWSDLWNSRDRQRIAQLKQRQYAGYYRILDRPGLSSYLAITNAGVGLDYAATAPYQLRLENRQGQPLIYQGSLPPQGTDFGAIADFFPTLDDFWSETGIGLVVIESQFDLACMHFSHNLASAVWSAEHFLPLPLEQQGQLVYGCGA